MFLNGFFDPLCGLGESTPTCSGATAREGLGFIRKLQELKIVGADINTISPPHDMGRMTAFWVAAVALEILTGVPLALKPLISSTKIKIMQRLMKAIYI